MEIGLSSACFYPKVEVEDSIELMKTLGFDIGELFINTPSEFEIDFGKILNENKEKHNFKINSVHGFSSFFEPLIFSQYKRRSKDMIDIFKKICILGNYIGADSYTFHGMRLMDSGSIPNKLIFEIYNELAYIANESGIKFSQENVCWCMSSKLNFLEELKDKVKYPLNFTLDIKQSNKAGIKVEEYIKIMGNKICNFHINDFDNENVCLLPGKGMVDYISIINQLKKVDYKGVGIIEVYGDNYKKFSELTESKNHLNSLFY
jgi:sugar phosphate isomerase/epimerase